MPTDQPSTCDLAFDALAESAVLVAVLDEMVPDQKLRSRVFEVCKEEFSSFHGPKVSEMHPEVFRANINRVVKDLQTLPLGEGFAVAAPEKFNRIERLGNSRAMKDLAMLLFGNIISNGATTLAKVHNAWTSYDSERAGIIWDEFLGNAEIASVLEEIIRTYAGEGSLEAAREDVKAFLTNEPKADQKLSKKSEAFLLLESLKLSLENALMFHALYSAAEESHIPEEAIKLTYGFAELDRMALRDMLENPLGQAQTASPEKAEGYFRSHETVTESGVQNNFGYVYLTHSQADDLAIDTKLPLCRPFRYMGRPYFAVPMGMYFKARDSGKYMECMNNLKYFINIYEGTPRGEYYQALLHYYDYGYSPDATVHGYHEACYDAERKWVAYARYAAEHKLPYIHVHPFEKYNTASTRTHNLELGIQNTEQTGRFEKVKRKFLKNAAAFLERSGVKAAHPDMAAETLRLIESAVIIAQAARLSGHGTIAQNIPNEQEGREDGVGILCDTDYCRDLLKTRTAPMLDQIDTIGEFARQYRTSSENEELFLLYYVLDVLSHELNHNLYKGKEQSYQSDGRGLAIKLIEEAKATAGIALAFRDPEHLTDDEIQTLRRAMPLLIPASLLRLRPKLLAEHKSNEYLREGAVMLDHLLKSGVLRVQGVNLDKKGDPVFTDGTEILQPQFAFLRLNLGKRELQEYIAQCARFLQSLAETYYKTQFTDVPPDTVIPDRTDIDVWQNLSAMCHAKDFVDEENRGSESDPVKRKTSHDALNRLAPREDPDVRKDDIYALVDLVDGTHMKRMKFAVARVHGLTEDDPALPAKIAELQAKISIACPQIMQ